MAKVRYTAQDDNKRKTKFPTGFKDKEYVRTRKNVYELKTYHDQPYAKKSYDDAWRQYEAESDRREAVKRKARDYDWEALHSPLEGHPTTPYIGKERDIAQDRIRRRGSTRKPTDVTPAKVGKTEDYLTIAKEKIVESMKKKARDNARLKKGISTKGTIK